MNDTTERTEDWARLAFARGEILQPELEDVLALVEVARAAQELVDAWYGDPNSTNLRDALARLDTT